MSNFNFNDLSEDETIRPPDGTTKEILINFDNNYHNYDTYDITSIIHNDYEYENELQMAINESIKEQEAYKKKQLEFLEEEEEVYEKNQLKFLEEEQKEQEKAYEKKQLEFLEKIKLRIKSFKDVLLKIKKIGMIDKTFLEFYNIIEPIIDSYCACNIDMYECDKVMYDEIFKTLKTIRLTESELELFKNLFVMEN